MQLKVNINPLEEIYIWLQKNNVVNRIYAFLPSSFTVARVPIIQLRYKSPNIDIMVQQIIVSIII